ncbi:MAG: hypothetical protein KatS3mg059_0027 [Thermomicrobiales bacterium]|nr:MAG: hypothetical protein KatS3mg059_0027 [Thermomicrobiales bacterium]
MAKPDHTWTGSSGHIHASLWDASGQHNLFAAHDGSAEMSDLMRWFLGGLMACTRELALFIAPNVNSYKRFAVASWAPVNIVWARDNRTCGFPHRRARQRACASRTAFPGGDANPYLAFAAVLAAGLLRHRSLVFEPPPEFRGQRLPRHAARPVSRARSTRPSPPGSESQVAREAFGEVVVAHYLNAARVEQSAFDAAVTDWERARYFERG